MNSDDEFVSVPAKLSSEKVCLPEILYCTFHMLVTNYFNCFWCSLIVVIPHVSYSYYQLDLLYLEGERKLFFYI